MAFHRYGIQGIGDPAILLVRPMKFDDVGDTCTEHEHEFGHAIPVPIGGLHVNEFKLADPTDEKSGYQIAEHDIDAPVRQLVEAIKNGEIDINEPDFDSRFFFRSYFYVVNEAHRHTLTARYRNTIAGCLYPALDAETKKIVKQFMGWVGCCG